MNSVKGISVFCVSRSRALLIVIGLVCRWGMLWRSLRMRPFPATSSCCSPLETMVPASSPRPAWTGSPTTRYPPGPTQTGELLDRASPGFCLYARKKTHRMLADGDIASTLRQCCISLKLCPGLSCSWKLSYFEPDHIIPHRVAPSSPTRFNSSLNFAPGPTGCVI